MIHLPSYKLRWRSDGCGGTGQASIPTFGKNTYMYVLGRHIWRSICPTLQPNPLAETGILGSVHVGERLYLKKIGWTVLVLIPKFNRDIRGIVML